VLCRQCGGRSSSVSLVSAPSCQAEVQDRLTPSGSPLSSFPTAHENLARKTDGCGETDHLDAAVLSTGPSESTLSPVLSNALPRGGRGRQGSPTGEMRRARS
jgi:hypothetical protein